MLKLGEIFQILILGAEVKYSAKPQGGEEKPLEKRGLIPHCSASRECMLIVFLNDLVYDEGRLVELVYFLMRL